MSAIKRLFGSFYVRILFVFLATVLLLAMTIGGTMRWIIKDGRHPLRPIAINHVQYVVNDIGIPPNLEKAIEITQQMPVRLAIRGPGVNWASEPGFIPEQDKPEWIGINKPLIVKERHYRFAIYPKGEYRFYMAWQYRLVKHKDKYKFFIGLAVVIVIFWISYVAAQRLLRPVREVSNAAKKIQQGDLNYRVANHYSGELGDLCHNVNNMADSINDMLEAKRQMLLAISHELRSPITRAKLNAEFVDEDKIRKRLVTDLDEMESLVGTLIESERLNQPHTVLQLESSDLNVLVHRVLARWPDQRFNVQLPEAPNIVDIDVMRFELMLRNVVSNAVRHGNGLPISVSLKHSAQQWHLRIVDQGDGIAEDHLPNIADPFYRPDDSRQRQTGGVGLGLYLAKRIIEAHQGQMQISSSTLESPQKGTSVTFIW